MFLNYLALGIILVVLVILFYTFVYIHELPYEAAKHRNHPQQDAIYVACWLSLFTLHAIWPLVFIWALSHKETVHEDAVPSSLPIGSNAITLLDERIKRLEAELLLLSQKQGAK